MSIRKTNLALYFHELSKDKSWCGKVKIPKNVTLWPENWSKVEYKEYKNKQQIFNHNENLKLTRSFIRYRKANLNNFNFPLKGGYLIAGSNHVGVFKTALL